MNTRALAAFLALLVISFPAGAEVNGYLSFDFSRGQRLSRSPHGTFENVEAGIILFAGPANRFSALVEGSLRGETPLVEQAWLGYEASRLFNFRIGLFPVPFGRYNSINRPYLTALVQPPLTIEHLFPRRWKDIGLQVEGGLTGFFYSAYIGNGLAEDETWPRGQRFADTNADKGKGFRVGLTLGSNVEAAYSGYWSRYDEDGKRMLRLQAVDAAWRTADFEVLVERDWVAADNPDGFAEGKGAGYLVLVSIFFGGLKPYASFQSLDIDDSYHGPGFVPGTNPGSGISADRSRWAAGIVFIPRPDILLKLEYDWNREGEGRIRDDLLSIQAAARF